MRDKWDQRKQLEPTLKRLNELTESIDSSSYYKLFYKHPVDHNQLERQKKLIRETHL